MEGSNRVLGFTKSKSWDLFLSVFSCGANAKALPIQNRNANEKRRLISLKKQENVDAVNLECTRKKRTGEKKRRARARERARER